MAAHPERIKHPWYKDLNLNGRKWRVFQAALGEIAASGCPVILYNGPSSPSWRQLSRDTLINGQVVYVVNVGRLPDYDFDTLIGYTRGSP